MKFGKIITAFLVGSLLLYNIGYAEEKKVESIKFSDIKDDYWAKSSIEKITDAGIIKGYPDGTFKPEEPVTRAEFVKIVNGVMGYEEGVSQTSFVDVKKDGWYNSAVLIAEKQGYITGFEDKTFRPNEKITKEQVCVIVSKMNNLKQLKENIKIPNDKISDWSKQYVLIVLSNRLMTLDEDGKFNPKQYATRALVADVLSKFLVEPVKEDKKEEVKKLTENKDEVKKEDTTTSSGGSGGGGGSSNSGTSSSKPEEKQKTEQEQIIEKAGRVIMNLQNTVELFNTEAEKEIIRDIISNMQSYISDSNYDYKSAVQTVKDKYNNLTSEEKEDLKNKIALYNNTEDLFALKDKLF